VVSVQELARSHTEQAVRTLVEALGDPKLKVQAAVALLDRGWGKPVQAIGPADDAQSITFMHLIAARACSDRMAAERVAENAGTTINATAETSSGVIDLLVQPALE
jgi:hypothetical protein